MNAGIILTNMNDTPFSCLVTALMLWYPNRKQADERSRCCAMLAVRAARRRVLWAMPGVMMARPALLVAPAAEQWIGTMKPEEQGPIMQGPREPG